jgi:dienelactone hydrolase
MSFVPREVQITPHDLPGLLGLPGAARGLVIFAHGSGSSRLSPRNQRVAAALHDSGIATLLLDLLTPAEEHQRRNVFDIELLASRLAHSARWARAQPQLAALPLGFFGASTGAAAALAAAAEFGEQVRAIVSRGGRPDLAGQALMHVRAPTLLIVGSLDLPVIEMNRQALQTLGGEKRLAIVPGAGHLFEEPGTLDEVVRLATDWFLSHLRPQAPKAQR